MLKVGVEYKSINDENFSRGDLIISQDMVEIKGENSFTLNIKKIEGVSNLKAVS